MLYMKWMTAFDVGLLLYRASLIPPTNNQSLDV